MKVFIVYDTKYGNTRLAAESILEGIRETNGIEAAIGYVKDVDAGKVADSDAVILGAPNHMGKPSRAMKKFVDQLVELGVKAKSAVVFGTYAGKERSDRAVKKLEKMLEQKLPNLRLILPGLSIRVNGVKGPVVEGELPKCVDFGRKIASQLTT
ncbi:MAG: flavodoxin domain-containing protein [Candidatus Bathyarchaeota archaeon]|nr:flavodoxin domain-containing protein [Candidatus Bathyarchaeota archaeon]